jgi:hypothetical protein
LNFEYCIGRLSCVKLQVHLANGVVLLPRKGYRSNVPYLALHGVGGAEASGLVFLKAKPPPAAAQGFWIAVRMRHGRSMRVAGWVLLVGGFLLCVSILAALGFLLMGFGLIFLQIAEQKDKSPATSDAWRSGQSEPERAPPPPRALSQAEEAREVVDRESAIDPNSYDRERWRLLLRNDADISRLVTALAPYGQKYVDELAAAYLALNDKDHLPMILREIIASARRDSRVASDLTDKNSNVEADGLAVDRTRRVDRVRDSRVGYADEPASVNNAPKVDSGLKVEQVSEPSGGKFSGDVDASAARKAAVEETNLKPPGAHRESNVSQAGQIAVEATNPEPPAIADAAVGADEKRVKREVDAVDADNLTDMLKRLSQDRPPKIE